jgi:anthranilate phosphoribosyltransferase
VRDAIAEVVRGAELSEESVRRAFTKILQGQATPSQIGAFLVALRMRPDDPEVLATAAAVMREHCVPVRLSPKPVLLDTCGTGGDGSNTFNISTTAALVIAACDVPVAKHGNRAASSKTGSADVLEALGVRVELTPEEVARCIDEIGIGFMFARSHHPAMRHVGQVRAELGVRTIFNLLGPLSNPASASHQVVGVPSPELLSPMALALGSLGCTRVWVVHGHLGLDELSLSGPTQVVELDNGELREFVVEPKDFGVRLQPQAKLTVDGVAQSAETIRAVLRGEPGAARDVVVLNAAAGLVVAGRAASFPQAAQLAAEAIDSGGAAEKLSQWVALSQAGDRHE